MGVVVSECSRFFRRSNVACLSSFVSTGGFWFGSDLVNGLHVVSFSGCLYMCIIVVHYCITMT